MEELEVADMRILIHQCSVKEYWYSEFIGEVFKAESYSHRDFYVVYNNSIRAILRKDAEFLNKKKS